MRAGLAALAVWISLAAGAGAQAPGESVDMARLCERGLDRRVRLESVSDATARLQCTVDAAGAPQSCAVTFAAPNLDTVRAIALSQMCYGRRADAALMSEGRAVFAFEFDVICSRAQGAQVCAAGRLRTRQIAGAPGAGG
jgi:hypothetical protein